MRFKVSGPLVQVHVLHDHAHKVVTRQDEAAQQCGGGPECTCQGGGGGGGEGAGEDCGPRLARKVDEGMGGWGTGGWGIWGSGVLEGGGRW